MPSPDGRSERVFKTAWFSKVARKARMTDAELCAAIRQVMLGQADDLGGGVGQTIGYIEGREAARPFDQPTPVDAINAALVDEIFYNPFKQ